MSSNQETNKSAKTLRRILTYIREYRLWVAFSLTMAVATVALTLYVPILTGRAVDRIVEQGNVDFGGLLRILRVILIAVAFTSVFQWLMNHINNKITYRVVKDVRTRAFNQLEVLPLRYIDSHSSGGSDQPHHRGYRPVLGRAAHGLHPAVHRRADDSGDAAVHALHQPLDHHCGGGPDAGVPCLWPALSPNAPTSCSNTSRRPGAS